MWKEMRESKTLPLMTQITLILTDQAMLLVLSTPVWHWRPRQCALKAKRRLCRTTFFTICVLQRHQRQGLLAHSSWKRSRKFHRWQRFRSARCCHRRQWLPLIQAHRVPYRGNHQDQQHA
jgi:hypothetical protein